MSKPMNKTPFEMPDSQIWLMEFQSVICTSWDDGYIKYDDENSLGEA